MREGMPRCTCGGIVKPDVVLYEEALGRGHAGGRHFRHAAWPICCIVGGTSLTVYPAAGLLGYYRGHRLVLINRDATPYDEEADLVSHDSLGSIFSQLQEL